MHAHGVCLIARASLPGRSGGRDLDGVAMEGSADQPDLRGQEIGKVDKPDVAFN